MCYHTPDLKSSINTDEKWEKCRKIQEFLEFAPSITKEHSFSLYVTMRFCKLVYRKSIDRCEMIIDQHDDELEEIAKLMIANLKMYKSFICS